MTQDKALEVLNSEEALEKKYSKSQFLVLTLVTIVLPVAIIIAVGVNL